MAKVGEAAAPAVEGLNLVKAFGGVVALDDASFSAQGGRCTRSWARTAPASRR